MSEEFDSCLETYDWRYSAAIVGLKRYLDHFNLSSNWKNNDEIDTSSPENDYFHYNKSDITEERYLAFAEKYYEEDFPHVKAERLLKKETYTDDDIKEINGLLTYNVVLKKFFGKEKFDGSNRELIEAILQENRLEMK